MDRARVEKQLRLDEGRRFTVYLDTSDIATVGIGHKVLPDDHLALGEHITGEQMTALFAMDLDQAIADCAALFPVWETFPEAVQEVLVNMCFNLGKTGLGKFHKMCAALMQHAYTAAAHEMIDSTWYGQVGNRAKRLVRRMKSVA